MRCDQFAGLNPWATKFVEGEPVLSYTVENAVKIFPDGRREKSEPVEIFECSVKRSESGEKYFGMFETEYPLHKYVFPDGKVLFERVQASPWSSGPVFFLALQDEAGNWVKESLWTEEEIENA